MKTEDLSDFEIHKLRNDWLLTHSVGDSVALRLWVRGSRRMRFRFELVGRGPVQAFMPNEEFDAAMRQGYDPIGIPKPLRESDREHEFLQMKAIWDQLNRLAHFV